jgi:hypothetical protein
MRLAILVAVTGCTRPAIVPQFANRPAATAVDDRRDVPIEPASRRFLQDYDFYENSVDLAMRRAFELPSPRRARGVNALDDVPDSTWFTNRIGVRDLSPDEVRRGPLVHDDPMHHRPWRVTSSTAGSSTIRFVVEDATGARYIVKFDPRDRPELESGAHLVVSRLLWAAGYNVPEDRLVELSPDDLVIAPGAKLVDRSGEKLRDLDRDRLLRDLSVVAHRPDGRIRALVSRYVDGKTLGGHPARGMRADDPNDRIPHERRRDLRGAYAMFSWLDHVDVMEGNFVDTWVGDGGRHYVVHYLIDFGKSLGVMAMTSRDARRGYGHEIDAIAMVESFASLGLAPRPWQGRHAPALVGVSPLFDAVAFDPGAWNTDEPYAPFTDADRFDKFWGAKLVARFTPAQIRAAVDAAELSDPRAADYLAATLVARQQRVIAHWFARVAPLDGFTVAAGALCFDDLAVAHGLAAGARYTVDVLARDATPRGHLPDVAASPRGCVPLPALPARDDGYTIVRLRGAAGSTSVHLARDAAGGPRVIGVWRD